MRRRFVPMSAVRAQGGHERDAMRSFPPLADDHPSIGGECAACGQALAAGDVVAIIPLGPGADPQAQATARAGGWYSCLGALAHAACAGLPKQPAADAVDLHEIAGR